ncbi:MAG: hypothetical protein NZ551_09290 [Microscillaceae bacterium]|nr:hypothetical protein [Microscillaceae bacterium]MDW8461394.1 hypothetical protein [Cytophagales bacterium]
MIPKSWQPFPIIFFLFWLILALFWDIDTEDLSDREMQENRKPILTANMSKKREKIINTPQILGTWKLPTHELYHTLHFANYTDLIIDNHIDTVFRFTYKLRNDTLFLYQLDNQAVLLYTNIIRHLNHDTLIFKNFMEKAEPQVYFKVKD